MSTLSQFAAGGIKSIQRGTATAPATVTITAVNTAKSMLIANSNNGWSYNFNPDTTHSIIARARLNSSTEVIVGDGNRIGSSNVQATVDWQVIEYF